MPASGMAIALDSLMQTTGGAQVAAGSGEADQEAVVGQDAIMVPLQKPKYKLRRLWLTREEEKGYYYGFSNEWSPFKNPSSYQVDEREYCKDLAEESANDPYQ